MQKQEAQNLIDELEQIHAWFIQAPIAQLHGINRLEMLDFITETMQWYQFGFDEMKEIEAKNIVVEFNFHIYQLWVLAKTIEQAKGFMISHNDMSVEDFEHCDIREMSEAETKTTYLFTDNKETGEREDVTYFEFIKGMIAPDFIATNDTNF